MSGLPDSLINLLRDALSRCDVFESDETLRSLFTDSRLSVWQTKLPQTNNIQQRAENAIHFLHNKFRGDNNALLSLLHVLQSRLDPAENLHGELGQLAQDLAAYLPTEASQTAESPYKGMFYYDVNDAPSSLAGNG